MTGSQYRTSGSTELTGLVRRSFFCATCFALDPAARRWMLMPLAFPVASLSSGAIFCSLPRSFSSCVSWAPTRFLLSPSFSIWCFLAQCVSRLFDFALVSAVPAVRFPTADFHFSFLPACCPSASADLFSRSRRCLSSRLRARSACKLRFLFSCMIRCSSRELSTGLRGKIFFFSISSINFD
jgi:hypothetical protein